MHRQHLFGDDGRKGVGPAQNRLLQRYGTALPGNRPQRARDVERRAIRTLIAPLPH